MQYLSMLDPSMRDHLLQAAGLLAFLVGAVPGILGETTVFAHATIEPPPMRLLLRIIWQAGAVAWMGGGVLIAAAPWLGADARRWIVLTFATVYAVGIVGNAWVSRGRHYGWMLLGAAVLLSLAGM